MFCITSHHPGNSCSNCRSSNGHSHLHCGVIPSCQHIKSCRRLPPLLYRLDINSLIIASNTPSSSINKRSAQHPPHQTNDIVTKSTNNTSKMSDTAPSTPAKASGSAWSESEKVCLGPFLRSTLYSRSFRSPFCSRSPTLRAKLRASARYVLLLMSLPQAAAANLHAENHPPAWPNPRLGPAHDHSSPWHSSEGA